MPAARVIVTDFSQVASDAAAARVGGDLPGARREVRLVDIVEYVQGALHHTMHGPGTGEN